MITGDCVGGQWVLGRGSGASTSNRVLMSLFIIHSHSSIILQSKWFIHALWYSEVVPYGKQMAGAMSIVDNRWWCGDNLGRFIVWHRKPIGTNEVKSFYRDIWLLCCIEGHSDAICCLVCPWFKNWSFKISYHRENFQSLDAWAQLQWVEFLHWFTPNFEANSGCIQGGNSISGSFETFPNCSL